MGLHSAGSSRLASVSLIMKPWINSFTSAEGFLLLNKYVGRSKEMLDVRWVHMLRVMCDKSLDSSQGVNCQVQFLLELKNYMQVQNKGAIKIKRISKMTPNR